MKVFFTTVLLFAVLLVQQVAYAAPNSEAYVLVEADNPSLDYREGQQAGFSIYKSPDWSREIDVEVLFQEAMTPLTVVDMGTHRYVQTPVLNYGPVVLTVNVYEVRPETQYVLMSPERILIECFEIEFDVNYNDFTSPTLSVLPLEGTIFNDDMPYMQVNYEDDPAGIDTASFSAYIISELGGRTDVTGLFAVNSDFATVQFDESNKLPVGPFQLEITLADNYGNTGTEVYDYRVEVPVPTPGYFVGQVVDALGEPVSAAEVSVSLGGTSRFERQTSVTTDAEGGFKLSVGQGGDVLLIATKAGWTSQSKRIFAESGKDSAVPTFTIKPLDPQLTFIDQILGGTGTNSENSVEFVVAPNSASADIQLNITQARSGDELPGALPILSEFTYMGTMGPSGTTFSPPGRLRIKNELGFPPATEIVVGLYNEATGLWEDSGSNGLVTGDGEFVEYDMPHFSSWDANQPVVPPADKGPSAGPSSPGATGGGCKASGCVIDLDRGNLGIEYELPGVVRFGKEYKPVLNYWSQSARPQLFASAQQFFRWLAVGDLPDRVQVEMSAGDLYRKVYYKGKDTIPSGDTVYSYRMMLEAKDTSGEYMPTGVYDFRVNIGNDYDNSRFATALFFGAPPLTPIDTITPEPVSLKYEVDSRSVVLNSRSSAFGKGWTLQGLEKLTQSPGLKVVWEDGTGRANLYTGIPTSFAPALNIAQGSGRNGNQIISKKARALQTLNVTSMIESKGSVYVADCSANQIYAVAVTGKISVVAGTGRKGFSGDHGPAEKAQLSCPSSVFPTIDGGLLVADSDNYRIRKVSKDGVITTLAGNGEVGQSDDLILAAKASIGRPTFVSQDKLKSIHFIAGDRIRFVDPRGKLQTLVASSGGYFTADLKEPSQIVYDEKDNLTIVDTGNDRIIKVFLQSGEVSVLAGSQDEKGREKLTMALGEAPGANLKRPISFLRDQRAQMSYILDQQGRVYVLSHHRSLLKTSLTSNLNSLVLSRNSGLLGVEPAQQRPESAEMPVSGFISSEGDFSTLFQLADGNFVRERPTGEKSYFNEDGYLTTKTTPDGKTETFSYDNKGRLSTWAVPGGESFIFTYDSFTGRLSQIEDPAGRVTEVSVNEQGQLVSIENPLGGQRAFTYDQTDLLITETDEDQNFHQYIYTPEGLLKEEIYPDGSVRKVKARVGIALMGDLAEGQGTEENPADMPVYDDIFGEDISSAGRVTEFKTDMFGKITSSRDGLGRETRIQRDGNGLPTEIIDPMGRSVQMTYNSAGLPTQIRDQVGNLRDIEYTSNFNMVANFWDEADRRTHFDFDSMGNMIRIVDPLLRETNLEYTPNMGLLTKIIAPDGRETLMTYNTHGLLDSMTDAKGNVTTYSYNAAGMMSQVTDDLGRITAYSYDDLNRMTKITGAAGGETTFTYSAKGLLESVTDPKGQTTSYTYNNRDQLIVETNALGQQEHYTYDRDGLLLTKTRRNGSVISYAYDDAGQLVLIVTPDDEIKFNYDGNGNLIWVKNRSGSVSRQFTADNLLRSENQNGFIVEYRYNPTKTRESMTSSGMITLYSYSGMDVLNGIQAQIDDQVYSWTRELDILNRPVKDTLPNGLETVRSFDELSQLESLVNRQASSSSLLSSFVYGYDDVGKRVSKAETLGITPVNAGPLATDTAYTYDNLDRLTHASSPSESFAYDAVGNRQFATGTSYNFINQLLTDGHRYDFSYNGNGDMTRKTNVVTGEETEYVWDARSQLVAISMKGITGNLAKEIFYKYDGLGRRIAKQVVDHQHSTKSYSRSFFYDAAQIIEEWDGDGKIVARYMNGPGIDDPILVSRSEGTFAFTKDGHGSIRELSKMNGTPIQRYRYSSYGVTTQELLETRKDKSLIENRYAFTGRELEEETGLYYYRARYYDPELGRFLSQDPIGFAGGDLNLYGYVGNDPVNWVDPEGEVPVPVLTGGVGAIIGVISGYGNSSCSMAGKFLDGAIGAGVGFAGGFFAGVGAGGATSSFIGNFFGAVGGTAAGAGPAAMGIFMPNGDELLGRTCPPPPPGGGGDPC